MFPYTLWLCGIKTTPNLVFAIHTMIKWYKSYTKPGHQVYRLTDTPWKCATPTLVYVYAIHAVIMWRTGHIKFEPVHEISNNMVCATSKASDQPAHTRSLIRAFASRLSILWLLSYWLNTIWTFYASKEATKAHPSLHLSKCQIVGNLMPRLI